MSEPTDPKPATDLDLQGSRSADLFAPLPSVPPPKASWWERLLDFVLRRKKTKKKKKLASTVYPLR